MAVRRPKNYALLSKLIRCLGTYQAYSAKNRAKVQLFLRCANFFRKKVLFLVKFDFSGSKIWSIHFFLIPLRTFSARMRRERAHSSACKHIIIELKREY